MAVVPLGLEGHCIREPSGVPGFLMGDWVCPHLILGQLLPSLDLNSQTCLGDEIKQCVGKWGWRLSWVEAGTKESHGPLVRQGVQKVG